MRPALLALAATGAGTTASWVPPTDPSGPPPGSPATLPAAPDTDSEALRFHAGDQVQTIGISADDPTWEAALSAAWSNSVALRTINSTPGSSLDYRSIVILQPGIYTLSRDWVPSPWASIIGATGDPADVQIISTLDDPEGGLIDGGSMALEGVTLSTPDTPSGTAEPPYGGPKYPIHWHSSTGARFHVAHCVLSNTNPTSHGSGFLGIDCESSGPPGGLLQMAAVTGTTVPGAWCGINAHNNQTAGYGPWTARLKNCDFTGAGAVQFTTGDPTRDRWIANDTQVLMWKFKSSPGNDDVSAQVLDTTTPITWDTI